MCSEWRTGAGPRGWSQSRILDLVTMPSGQVDPRNEPFASMTLVAPDHIESRTGRLLARRSASEQAAISGKYMFAPGDVVYSKIRPYLRKAILAEFEGLSSADMYPLRPSESVSPRFLLALVLGEHFSRFAEIVSMRSGFPKINRSELGEYTAALPPLPEQQLIASILDTVDEVIRKTEEVIAKLQQMKQGLLHDLLTRGIDDNGELRDPDRHPEQFKDSELGRIPKDWEVVGIDELAHNHDGKRVPLKQADRDKRSGPFPYYGASGIIDWVDDFIFDGEYVLLGEDGENVLSRKLPLAFRTSGKCWVNDHAHVLEPRDGVDVEFLVEVLEAQDYIPYSSGSAQPKLTQSGLKQILFKKPERSEQERIVSSVSAHRARVAAEQAELSKLRLLKSGLMDDLLTGRVRVTDLLPTTTTP